MRYLDRSYDGNFVGGVASSLKNNMLELTDNWLYHIRAIYMLHKEKLECIKRKEGEQMMLQRLCELNIARSVRNVCSTTVIQNAWRRGQNVSVRGWAYSLADGIIRDLSIVVNSSQEYLALSDEFE
jgi:carbonic anhydrase